MDSANKKIIIFTDTLNRDGIGIELYINDIMILEIFRDDSANQKYINLFQKDVSLDIIEECISIFNRDIIEKMN